MLRSSHDACGCSTQTTSTINLKRSTLQPHEGQADRPNTPSDSVKPDSVNPGSNPGPPATLLTDIARFYQFSFALKFVRHVRRLLTLDRNGRLPETQYRDETPLPMRSWLPVRSRADPESAYQTRGQELHQIRAEGDLCIAKSVGRCHACTPPSSD